VTLRPKLLVLTSSFPRWPGDQTCDYVRQLAMQLSQHYEVTVLTPACHGAVERELDQGVSVIRFHYFFPRQAETLGSGTDDWLTLEKSLWARVGLLFYLAGFLLNALWWGRGADVILSHWLVPSGLVGAGVASWLGKPHLVVEHSGALRVLRRLPGGRRLAQFILKRSRRVVTVSQELRRRLIELAPEAAGKTIVISMGVHTSALAAADEPRANVYGQRKRNGEKVVLYLGRLTGVKGVANLIQAMAGVGQAQLVIAGAGECEAELRKLARQCSITATFLGPVNEHQKRDWLRRCYVVVIPSVVLAHGRTEGLPVVCLEALAAGKPVIASRVGGLPEVIRDGENGFLVEPANVLNLRAALKRALGDEELYHQISAQARHTAKQYDWKAIGERYCEVVESVIGRSEGC